MSEKVRKWERIIIFRQGRLGDTIVAFPLIQALKKLFPAAAIVYCTQNFRRKKRLQGHEVADLSPYIDQVAVYDFEDSAGEKYRDLKRKLKPGKNDLLIYLPYNRIQRYQILRDWLFFRLLNFRHMICFKENWNWTYFYARKQNQFRKEHLRLLDFVSGAGIPVVCPERCDLRFATRWAADKLTEWGIAGADFLAVCPGSNMPSKVWPAERYVRVGKEWHRRTGMPLVIIGGPEEQEAADRIARRWPGYGFSACGASLTETTGLLARARLYCGNDTGGMHLAAILGIPCLAVFSARERRELWYPMYDRHIVLRENMECEACNLEKCHTEPPACLAGITVDQVLEGLEIIYDRSEK
ncbi:MAG: glycosyltransferase family 9 protein [Victivallaceae bacterium]|nr:glycosyltransferase family 9 protein [Victivallaceae bacterium]